MKPVGRYKMSIGLNPLLATRIISSRFVNSVIALIELPRFISALYQWKFYSTKQKTMHFWCQIDKNILKSPQIVPELLKCLKDILWS